MKKQNEAKPNKTFTDSIFDVEGKDYRAEEETRDEKITRYFIWFIIIFATGYFGLHYLAFLAHYLTN